MKSKLLFEKELEPIFLEKFPAFPEDVKNAIVQYGPYVMVVFAVLGLVALLGAGGLGSVLFGLGAGTLASGFAFYVSILVGIVTTILYLMAFKPLRAKQKAGWNLLYYAMLISMLGSLIQLQILALLISGAIGFWVLFQIREKYV